MNNVTILGTITRDIEIRHTQDGRAVGGFGIAYNERWKSADGERKEKAHFFDVTVFGKQAEVISQYFSKGSRILISGSLDFQQWEADGQKRSKVSIKLDGFDFIDRKSDESNSHDNHNVNNQQKHTDYKPREVMMPNKDLLPIMDLDDIEVPF